MRYQLNDSIRVSVINTRNGESITLHGHVRPDGLAIAFGSEVMNPEHKTHWMLDLTLGSCPVCRLPVIPMLEASVPVWTCRHDLPKDHPLFLRSDLTSNISDDEVRSLCPYIGKERDICPVTVCVHDSCYDLLLGDSVAEVQSR